jgi:hypothetical protein
MEVLACDGIHEGGLGLFRDAGWNVEISEWIKAITVDRAVHTAELVASRGVPGVSSLETL